MSIECYNTLCNFHNKIEPFCEEVECHCINGDPEEPILFYRYPPPYEIPPLLKKNVVCYTCKTVHKCDFAWIDQNIEYCMYEWGMKMDEWEENERKRKACKIL